MASETPNLFVFFFETFSVDEVYNLGWYAARDWMVAITGMTIALALGIRMVEEKVNFFTQGKSDYRRVFTNVALIAIAIGVYFTLASLVIDFFNAIYGALDNSTMQIMADQLDQMTQKVFEKDLDIGWSIAYESIFFVGALLGYGLTYAILVFIIFAMRLAHAVLVSFVIFWGCVALPMSMTTSLKQLQPLKTIAILALIWPIIDAFLMYLVGGAFMQGMENENFQIPDGSISMEMIIFYLVVFSIINIFLIATTAAAPFIAQGMANGSGNVTGLIGSFAAAGISAGALAGSAAFKKYVGGNKEIANRILGKSAAEGGTRLRAAAENGINRAFGAEVFKAAPSPQPTPMKAQPGSVMDKLGSQPYQPGSQGEQGKPGESGSSYPGMSNTNKAETPPPSGKEEATNRTGNSGPGPVKPASPKNSASAASSLSDEDMMREKQNQEDNPTGNMADQQRKNKAKSQAKRAAIIRQQKKPGDK